MTELKSRETRVLTCKLTDLELVAAVRLHQQAMREKATVEVDWSEAKAHWKRKLDRAAARTDELGRKVETGEEDRNVVVETWIDWQGLESFSIRTDTGEEISRRALTPAERQMQIAEAQRAGAVEPEPVSLTEALDEEEMP